MIPAVVIRNNPLPEYLEKYGAAVGQRHMMARYVQLIDQMQAIALNEPKVTSEIKLNRKYEKIKLKGHQSIYKDLLHERANIEKHFDYCAVFTASLDEVQMIDSMSEGEFIKSGNGPFVVRAMASKKFMELSRIQNRNYIFLENGYFGNYKNAANEKSKKIRHRICFNEMQQENILDVPDDRWNTLVSVDDRLRWPGWKKNGGKILLVVPSQKPCQHYGQDVNKWKADTISEIKKYTDRDIVIREKGSRTERTQKQTIYEALDDDIFCMVTYQSIAAVESVAYGIPVFTLAPSAAKKVSLQDLSQIEKPYYPDPDLVHRWCCSLAYGQFSLSEMLNGYAWQTVMDNINRDTISC